MPVGIPPIMGAGIGPLGLGPQHEELIRQAQAADQAKRLELEEFYRPEVAGWERGEDEFDRARGLPPRQDITEISKPLVTPGRQNPNEIITPFNPPFTPAPPPYGLFQPLGSRRPPQPQG
jgi:hypothetical protein